MKGRGNYLCLHRFEQALHDDRPRDDETRVAMTLIEHWAPRTQTGDRAELADLPEDLPVLARHRRDHRELPRQRVPALHRLLRHADAPGGRRRRRGDRQSPPALRRRRGPAAFVRRGHSRMPGRHHRRSAPARGRGHAVLRRDRQQLPRRAAVHRRGGDPHLATVRAAPGCAGRGAGDRGTRDRPREGSSSTCRHGVPVCASPPSLARHCSTSACVSPARRWPRPRAKADCS